MKVLGISGSLRKGSWNTSVLRAAQGLAPAEMTIEIGAIGDIPLYNEDVRATGSPASVERFSSQIAAADAVLFVSPEYNFSIPGVLENAIDWASRPPNQPFNDKPVSIMGASGGPVGTARMQYDLRKSLGSINALVMLKPEVFISQAGTKIDEAGNLTDETTRDFIRKLLEALAAWTNRMRSTASPPELPPLAPGTSSEKPALDNIAAPFALPAVSSSMTLSTHAPGEQLQGSTSWPNRKRPCHRKNRIISPAVRRR
jgi:chromate reductase